jgi:hypothetical protein
MGPAAACGSTPSSACQALQGALQDRATFGNASVGSFIAGGTIGAATLIYALATPRGVPKGGVRLAPMFARAGGGAALQGAW